MPVNLLVASVFVSEVTPLAVRAVLLSIELPAVLRLVLVVEIGWLLLVEVQFVVLAELLLAVGVLALDSVATKTSFHPLLAHVALVHRPLHKTFLRKVSKCQARLGTALVDLGFESASWVWTFLEVGLLLQSLLWGGLDGRDRSVRGHETLARNAHDLLDGRAKTFRLEILRT